MEIGSRRCVTRCHSIRCRSAQFIVLAGNKLDMEAKRTVTTAVWSNAPCCFCGTPTAHPHTPSRSRVHIMRTQEALACAEEKGVRHFEISAKTNTNIQEVFLLIGACFPSLAASVTWNSDVWRGSRHRARRAPLGTTAAGGILG